MNLGMEPSQWAEMLAGNVVQSMKTRLQAQQARVKGEQDALSLLKTSMSDFRSALKGIIADKGVIKNAASASQEGIVTLKASASASKGLYQFSVKQTAAAEQTSFPALTSSDLQNASGQLSLTVKGKTMSVDISTINDLTDLRNAINKDQNNPGVTASLMKINGKTELMISSNDTGLESG